VKSLAATFSGVVEELHRLLESKHPDLVWEKMRDKVLPPDQEGWYSVGFISARKDKQYFQQSFNLKKSFKVRKNADGTWSWMEV